MTSFLRARIHELDDAVRDLLENRLAERLEGQALDSDADHAILARIGAHVLSRYLPGEVLRDLEIFCVADYHCLLLRNLPGQRFPATPIAGFAQETELGVANAVHFGLIRLLGLVPYAVSDENCGRLIRNVVPNPAATGVTSSWGADAEFTWHTDNPHMDFGSPGLNPRPYIPHYLTFYSVRNQERVPTEVAAVADVTGALETSALRDLRATQFSIGAPASNDVGPARQRRRLDGASVLAEASDIGQEWARYDGGTTRGLTESAHSALAAWQGALAATEGEEFVLSAREFLIFDNYRVVHRRRAFVPAAQPDARWLRRCYAS